MTERQLMAVMRACKEHHFYRNKVLYDRVMALDVYEFLDWVESSATPLTDIDTFCELCPPNNYFHYL